MGIDTPESRTSDEVEKLFGKAAKTRLKELLHDGGVLVTTEEASGEDMRGKFGRILGDFKTPDGKLVTEVLAEEGHCVPYFGGSKEDVQAQHMRNRERLLAEGVVDRASYDKAVKLMEGK
jgi:micrococcal nuclease